ncbi:T9SS type A sorting domain-containing protein [Rufibacter latericius]|uniref:T9SS C-terminal target domain-containing protein n=1 Tax=Rufibacter latericius TaxID=2487040 RepID=A0A3M9MKD1_9BACT|nr:T9SS type A sorting domain-containing protein [Rufibacter latericius]RNI25966.1 T9SS C-terminal target domain-containing protein [Rufibacter latericius]
MNRALKVLAFFLSWMVGGAQTVGAQNPVRMQEVSGPVVQNSLGQPLRLPWAGGFNSPQFSAIDLNQDGQQDLFVFDRSSQRVTTFLAVQTNGTWGYQHAPQYENAFPKDLRFFALLRDFNCDGAPDLFTASNLGMAVYTNTSSASGGLQFNLTHPAIYFNTGANLLLGSEDMPALVDMDNDGDLDILTWEWSGGTTLEYYRNERVEQGLVCNTLTFTRASTYWGQVTRCVGTCNNYRFNENCPSTSHIGGSSVLPLDLDANGVLDLLVGHDDCPDLVSLYNTGTNAQPKITSAQYNLPPNITGQQFSVFPAAYYLDVTFDNVPDLVVAPNMTSNSHQNVNLKNSVWVYANTGTAAKPAFPSQKHPFLQDQMLEVGEGAAPAIANLTGNEALDVLVGNTAVLENGRYTASLTLFQNKGTAADALFEAVDSDYLGFAALNLISLKPQLLDINADGKIDLAWSAYRQSTNTMEFRYILNEATAGQTPQFVLANAVTIPGILLFRGDTPYLYDVDTDGKLDVLIGRSSGGLTYYRNTGTSTSPTWVLVSDSFGGLAADVERRRLQVTIADVNQDSQPDLLATDDSGKLRVFPAFQAHLSGTFPVEENVLWQPNFQQYGEANFGSGMSLAIANLDANSLPEILIGTLTGGLRFVKVISEPLGTENPVAELSFGKVFPNPADKLVQLITEKTATYQLHNVAGALIKSGKTVAGKPQEISTAALPAGLYLLRLQAADGRVVTHKLVVRH